MVRLWGWLVWVGGWARAGLPEPRVDAAIRDAVANTLAIPGHDVEVSENGLGRSPTCGQTASYEVRLIAGEDFVGPIDLWLIGTEAGRECDRLRLRVGLRIWRSIPVAARSTAPGELVQSRIERVASDRLQGTPVSPESGPWVATTPLSEGDPLTIQRVRAKPDARAGAPVTLVVRSNGLVIRAPGRLVTDAMIGETVRVVNTATGKVVEGRLGSPTEVHIGGDP